MERKNIKKTVGIASMALAVIAGTAAGVRFYNSGNLFVPSESERDFVANQVHFDNDKDMMGSEDNNKGSDSSFWEKNKDSDNSYSAGGSSGYLFDNPQINKPSNDNEINIVNPLPDDTSDINPGTNIKPGPIYDITDDKNNADTIINGGGKNDNNTVIIKPGNNNGGSTGNNGNASGDDTPGNGGNGGNGSSDNDDNHGGNASDDKPSDNTGSRPADTAKDPEYIKDNKPNLGIQYKPFNEKDFEDLEDAEDDGKELDIIIRMSSDSDSTMALYKGQAVSRYMVFCALDTYVYNGKNSEMYYWGDESYNKYVRIDAISFDGGNTWDNDFPVTIPDDDSRMVIKISYKLTSRADWRQKEVEYSPMSNRIFVLKEKLKENNQTISNDNVLNNNQFVNNGDIVNLYACHDKIIQNGRLNALFPGWEENGKLVPWMYSATTGRHILEPADMVALDDRYIVEKKYHWVYSDGTTDIKRAGVREFYCPLQTLTGISGKTAGTLDVPEYIQALEVEDDTEVDYIKIPDTVIAVSNKYLHVNKGYIVDENNPNYASSRGVLVNRDMTEIVGIPCRMTWVDIPDTVRKINLTSDNSLRQIRFNIDSLSDLPEIDYSDLSNCKIIVKDNIFDEFIMSNGQTLTACNNTVARESEPDDGYRLSNGAIYNDSGELYKVISTAGTSIILPNEVNKVCSGSLADAKRVENLILPDEDDIVLEKDCLKDTSIKTLVCSSEKQLDNISSMIENAGGKDIELVIMNMTSDGYSYYTVNRDGKQNVMLAKVPENIEEFDGTIAEGTINVNTIGTYAFAKCGSLKWVNLPESVTKIEYGAFIDCKKLQGVLIRTKESIVIGNCSFDGCNLLRFIASNAMNCTMIDDYDPVIKDVNDTDDKHGFFMTLAGSEGYGSNSSQGSSDIARYDIVESGQSRILYGVDSYDMYYIALRAGTDISGEVSLPEYTTTIGEFAFSGAGKENGFTVDWDGSCVYDLRSKAFFDSGIKGDMVIPDKGGILVDEAVFGKCERLTSVKFEGTIYKLGKDLFVYSTSLNRVEFSSLDYWRTSIYSGIFNGCNELTEIVFDDYIAPQIIFPSVGYGFRFNYELTAEEEMAKIHLVVPEESVSSYIMNWRYYLVGYTDYDTMWESIQFNLFFDTFEWPEDEAVDAAVKEHILEAENYVRSMIGLETVESPTDYYPYREENGLVTLIDACSYRKVIDLGADYMGLPGGWFYDYIGKNAFASSKGLEQIVIPDNLVGVMSGAFADAAGESGSLIVKCSGSTPFELVADSETGSFEFGIDDKNLTILVPKGSKDKYIEAWSAYIDAKRLNTIIKESENTEE
ncbi:MAG: leucine-rich repeat protein [Lachnospiraceae bacterium]|nr:leucine-rich repeat protein [Lachnospiraceae bacterium]